MCDLSRTRESNMNYSSINHMHYVKRLHTSEMLCSVHDKSKKPFRIAAYNLKVSTISIEHGFNITNLYMPCVCVLLLRNRNESLLLFFLCFLLVLCALIRFRLLLPFTTFSYWLVLLPFWLSLCLEGCKQQHCTV